MTQRIGATAITLSARETATGFYEKFGFRARGERFERHGVGYVNMLLECSRLGRSST
ncbi:GNAT family N-acetyltransferase [Pseudomonas sp. S12(2018)]|uniref:GNAT family N-acetyltransferase n=1 Tax=Pseudomonas TaxID=286 RepID=UPI0034E93A2A